jgi:alkaline phosphatase
VILLISDGAGLSQIWAAATANSGALNVMNCHTTGYLITTPSDDYNTDSAAAGTALATGQKTRNRHIGVDHSGAPVENVIERLAATGMACGIVSNDGVAGATPSAFYAHQPERGMTEAILNDMLSSPASLIIAGGGRQRNPEFIDQLEEAGFAVCEGIDALKAMPMREGGQTVCLDSDRYDDGYRVIETVFDESVRRLSNDPDGFFLMMEGSKIDSGGHDNDINRCIDEYLSFDRMVGKAIEFADHNGETLVVIVSDHETGGLVLIDGNYETGSVLGHFVTNDHTGTPVPVFSYGPSSNKFSGFIQNSDIMRKILDSLAD